MAIENWLTGALVFCAVALFAASFILKLHEWGFWLLQAVSRMLHRPWFETALLLFFVGGLVQYGSTKGSNGTNPLNPDTDGDGMSDGTEFSLGTDPNDPETYEVDNVYDENIYVDGEPMLLKTGRFAFQAHVDDTVTASIGSKIQFSADYYGTNQGIKTNGILIAGQSYPVTINAASIGGPAELSFPVWGEFTPILKPQIAAKHSHLYRRI